LWLRQVRLCCCAVLFGDLAGICTSFLLIRKTLLLLFCFSCGCHGLSVVVRLDFICGISIAYLYYFNNPCVTIVKYVKRHFMSVNESVCLLNSNEIFQAVFKFSHKSAQGHFPVSNGCRELFLHIQNGWIDHLFH
jgi:hypothetical protein